MTSLPEQQSLLITEQQIITPLVEVLDQVKQQPVNSIAPSKSTSQSITESLNSIFPEQQYEEKTIQKAKEILGPLASNFSSEELKVTLIEIQFLAESWLDDFEREIFEGLTPKEMLHEKGGK